MNWLARSALKFLNALLLLGLVTVAIVFVSKKGCTSVPERPGHHNEIVAFIDALNVVSNLLLAVPGIVMCCLGFVGEGVLVILSAVFSCLWHGTNSPAYAMLDQIFASIALVVVIFSYLRVCQMRGCPETLIFQLVFPLAAVAAFSSSIFCKSSDEDTKYVVDRIGHVMWHLLAATTFMFTAMELLRVYSILPNGSLSAVMRHRDRRMRRPVDRGPTPSIIIGFFEDLLK